MEAINIGKISAIFFECRLIYSLQAVQRALISSHFFAIAFWFSLFLFRRSFVFPPGFIDASMKMQF